MSALPDRGLDFPDKGTASDSGSVRLLDGLSELAARRFTSTEEAVGVVLSAISEQVGTRSSFLTRITRDAERSEILAAFNAPGGCDVPAGVVLALPQTF